VAVYSEADKYAQHVEMADESVRIGPAPVKESYLNISAILDAAKATSANSIHPGYGLLSENAEFAETCESSGIAFIGPTPDQMRRFGLKHTAREIAIAENAPLLPGSGLIDTVEEAIFRAAEIGYPVMLKSTAGGGGIGMQLCWDEEQLQPSFESVKRLSANNFANNGIFLEKYVQNARHIEAQIFGDGKGGVIALGERDCSVQRRNQKVIEETPAPNISESLRKDLLDTAVRLAKAVSYRSAGTVEFVYDVDEGQYYFLEVNTRLQVEHCVTEAVTGVDLVEWMVRLASGNLPELETLTVQPSGAAIQARLYAEDPNKDFLPSSGLLTQVSFPEKVRVDTWIETSTVVTANYDPLLAKIIAHGTDRSAAIRELSSALEETRIDGIETNREYLCQILRSAEFSEATHTTKFCDKLDYHPHTIDVVEGGTQTTIQDYPGRRGYWNVGIPPSGPFDALAFRAGNFILGNPNHAAGLEITVVGPSLLFNQTTTICLTGAKTNATLNGKPVPFWQPVKIGPGDRLNCGKIEDRGCRAYLTLSGGLDAPEYLGSRATFTLGQFGGHCGRSLLTGDVLRFKKPLDTHSQFFESTSLSEYGPKWKIRVLYGPHGAPDFFTENDIRTFFEADWEVHYNSSRTGVRLIGPKPEWARKDGGEAGLHPSNIHDNAYAIGTIDFTGDMPVILGPDGPSLGGFVCPACIIKADLWMMGQLQPGDTIRFVRVNQAEAAVAEREQESMFNIEAPKIALPTYTCDQAIIDKISSNGLDICYRRSGDKYLLVEYGPMELDLNLRFRAHALMEAIEHERIPGIEDLTPGIRSLQIHYDSLSLSLNQLVEKLQAIEASLTSLSKVKVPSRIVHLPLSWDDEATQLAIRKYEQSVRKNAPWCPSNIEFIRRINGLDSIDDVKEIVFNANYMVMGLGDVYLGAPVATPIDPRHRLVTTKYNPARTWTPENAVGIGGAYLCIYGMEGPGGYQFVGRTVQMWNRYKQTQSFRNGKPWLLRFFDQIKFYPVSGEELLELRDDFIYGRFNVKIEETEFDLDTYNQFLDRNAASIDTFKSAQQNAFETEREQWIATGQATFESDPELEQSNEESQEVPEGWIAARTHVPGNVWKIEVEEGDSVEAGDTLIVVESMKMEIGIEAPVAGTIGRLLCTEGTPVKNGQILCSLKPA